MENQEIENDGMSDIQHLISQSIVSKAFNMFLRTDNGLNTALIKMFENYVDIGEGVVIDLDDELKGLTDEHKYMLYVGPDYAFCASPINDDILDSDGNPVEAKQGDIVNLDIFGDDLDDDFDEDED